MNPTYQLYYVSMNYLSQIYENSPYYYQSGQQPRIFGVSQVPQQSSIPQIDNIMLQQGNANNQDFTTKANQQTTKTRKKKKNQSEISQNSLIQQSQEQINIISRQKYGRNIISNIVHHMIKKFFTQEFDDMIGKIIKHHNISTTLAQFKEQLRKRASRLGIYLKYAKIKALLKGHQHRNRIKQQTISKQTIFNKIFRILYFYYLKNVHILHLYNTLKLKQKSKRFHIEGVTKLLQLLNQ